MAANALIGDPDAHLLLRAERFDSISIVNNWKAAHQYPQITFRSTLNYRTLAVDPSHGIAVGLSKRLSSIKSKLERYNWLKLSEMQDVTGCRSIVSSVNNVHELVALYKHSHTNHTIDGESDYIGNLKSDSYRSYHLINCYANSNQNELTVRRVVSESAYSDVAGSVWTALAVKNARQLCKLENPL
jgi:hypothetical protein